MREGEILFIEKIPYVFIENASTKSPQMRVPITPGMDRIQLTIRMALYNLKIQETYFSEIMIVDEDSNTLLNIPSGPIKLKPDPKNKEFISVNAITSPIIKNPKTGNYLLTFILMNNKQSVISIQHSYFSFVKKDGGNAK